MESSSPQPFQKPEGLSKESASLLREYEAVRNFAGLFNFTSVAKISIKGKDRVKFLQGLTSNDISKLSEGTGLYTILPSIKGKIESEAMVYAFSNYLLLILHPDLREKTLRLLNKFKIGSDVQMEDLTQGFFLLSVQGPRSEKILFEWLHHPLSELQSFHFVSLSLEGVPIQIIRNGWSGEMGFDLLIPFPHGAEIQTRLLEKGKFDGLIPVGEEAFETIRIEAGLPQYGAELSDEVLPQEAGLEQKAISYTKGCYIGQETIARLHYLGHTNRSLVGLFLDHDIPDKNDKIVSGDKEIGWITSRAFSPLLKRVISLGYLHRQYVQAGTAVEINHQGEKMKAVVAALPFYRPEQKKEN
jgi:glycine cleavage system T protein